MCLPGTRDGRQELCIQKPAPSSTSECHIDIISKTKLLTATQDDNKQQKTGNPAKKWKLLEQMMKTFHSSNYTQNAHVQYPVHIKKPFIITGVTNRNWIEFGAGFWRAFQRVLSTKRGGGLGITWASEPCLEVIQQRSERSSSADRNQFWMETVCDNSANSPREVNKEEEAAAVPAR